MSHLARAVCLGLLAAATMVDAASAQYYPPPPPPYYPPGYYRPRPPPRGFRCEARERTGYGRRPVICPLARPKPLGTSCVCPPAYPGEPYARGRVVP